MFANPCTSPLCVFLKCENRQLVGISIQLTESVIHAGAVLPPLEECLAEVCTTEQIAHTRGAHIAVSPRQHRVGLDQHSRSAVGLGDFKVSRLQDRLKYVEVGTMGRHLAKQILVSWVTFLPLGAAMHG